MNRLISLIGKPLGAAAAVLLAAATPGTAGFSTPALAQETASDLNTGDLNRAVAALRGISTLRASFIQTDRSGQSLSGVMTLKRPGKIRFEYEKGVGLLIVSTGGSLYMIDYDVKQVQRWPIRNSPLGALLDPSRDVSRYGALRPTGNDNVVSIEVRDPKKPEFGMITLIFLRDASAPGGLELVSWIALDAQNKRTTVRLSDHRYDVPVSDSAFRFRDPRVSPRR